MFRNDSELIVNPKISQASSDFYPESQDVQTERFKHLNELLDLNKKRKYKSSLHELIQYAYSDEIFLRRKFDYNYYI